jgi:putative RNA 2'-phosphotransferase
MEPRDRRGPRGPRGARRSGPPKPPAEERLSRFLAFVLRHHPEEAGLTLDEQGSVDLDALAAAVRTKPGLDDTTRERIERLVASGLASQRFEITGNRIRARYGHSVAQSIQYEPAAPPADLFLGTTPEIAETILADGLKPFERQRVHLSVDTPAAREVGRHRCPDPVILRIDTACARKAGVQFYRGGPAVWLSDAIPPQCIARVE